MPRRRLTAVLSAGLLLLVFAGPVSAAKPAECWGTVTIAPTEAPSVRVTPSGVTFVDFEFAGTHTYCPEEGAEVLGTIEGHLWQRTQPNGDLTLRFHETFSLPDGSIDFRGNASLSGEVWTSAVRSVGPSSGSLAGVNGQGSFFPTADPSVLVDVIYYVYN